MRPARGVSRITRGVRKTWVELTESNHSKAGPNQEWDINNNRCNIEEKKTILTHTHANMHVNSSSLEDLKRICQIVGSENSHGSFLRLHLSSSRKILKSQGFTKTDVNYTTTSHNLKHQKKISTQEGRDLYRC